MAIRGRQQDVVALDVSLHDVKTVEVLERESESARETCSVAIIKRTFCVELRHCVTARHIGEQQAGSTIGCKPLEQRKYIWVVQL